MQSVVYDATKKVPNPDKTDTQFKTVYDKWLHAFPNSDKTQPRYIMFIYFLSLIEDNDKLYFKKMTNFIFKKS